MSENCSENTEKSISGFSGQGLSWTLKTRNVYFCKEGKLSQGEGVAGTKAWNCDGGVTSPGNREYIPIYSHMQAPRQNLATSVPHEVTGLCRQSPYQSQSPELLGCGADHPFMVVYHMEKLR